jgi:hypothetical protein
LLAPNTADAVLTNVRAWQRRALRQGEIDPGAVKVSTAQHGREQAHLRTRACPFALDASGRQGRLATDRRDKVFVQGVDLGGNGLQELRAARRR